MMNILKRTHLQHLKNNLRKSSRRFLTLLELLIVISILAITASVLTFNIAGIFRDQRFRADVEKVVDKLQMAQNVMLILNSDVTVSIAKNDQDQYVMKLKAEKPLPLHLDKIAEKKVVLDGINEITFNDEKDSIVLEFKALKHVVPTGILTMKVDEELESSVTLFGYSHPIVIGKKEILSTEEIQNESALLYPKEVRELWQQKLEAKEEPKKEEKEDLPSS